MSITMSIITSSSHHHFTPLRPTIPYHPHHPHHPHHRHHPPRRPIQVNWNQAQPSLKLSSSLTPQSELPVLIADPTFALSTASPKSPKSPKSPRGPSLDGAPPLVQSVVGGPSAAEVVAAMGSDPHTHVISVGTPEAGAIGDQFGGCADNNFDALHALENYLLATKDTSSRDRFGAVLMSNNTHGHATPAPKGIFGSSGHGSNSGYVNGYFNGSNNGYVNGSAVNNSTSTLGYLGLVNFTSTHGSGILMNQVHTAYLRSLLGTSKVLVGRGGQWSMLGVIVVQGVL